MVEKTADEAAKTEKKPDYCKPFKLSVSRVIAIGIIFAVIAFIIHYLFAFATMDYYIDANYLSVWSKIMMPTEGPPPASFYYYSIGFSLITGILFAIVFTAVGCGVPGKGAKKGFTYGFLVFLIGTIPGHLALYLLINLPAMLIFIWAIEGLIVLLIAGAITAKIIK